MNNKREIVEAAIRERDPSAKDITLQLVVNNFLEGSIYYAEFASTVIPKDESFFYVFIQKDNQIKLYDDGVNVIEGLQVILDKRRSFLQRLNEFTLVEMIGAVIAMVVTVAFVYTVIGGKEISKEITGIFGIIAGYYFGKNIVNKG